MKKIKKIAFAALCVILAYMGIAVVISLVLVVPVIGVPLAVACVALWFWRWSKLKKSKKSATSTDSLQFASTQEKRAKPPVVPASSSPLSLTINREIEIMNDCVSLVNTSANLQTVLYRYGLLLETLHQLSEYENNPAVSFPHELPSVALERIKSEKSQIMNRAVQRAYDDVLHKCATLKTEKGPKNRQMKFFDELNALMENFPPETQDFVVDFVNQNINDPLTHLEGL